MPPLARPIPALVLAAGLSSRMGAFKPLLPLSGKPLILHVIDSLRTSQAIAPIIVVTGHQAEVLEAALPQDVLRVFNPRFAEGEMLSSLRAGMTKLSATHPPAFLLAFADQPAVLSTTISALADAFHARLPPLVLPLYRGKKGHPILLSARLIPEIAALSDLDTLRTVVHRHLSQATLVPVEDPATLEDLDTPEDFARAEARHPPPRPC